MDINNSPKRCMNLCNTHRFKYAAVKGYTNFSFLNYIIYLKSTYITLLFIEISVNVRTLNQILT